LKGVELDLADGYYTDQSGDLLDTFSIPLIRVTDASIYYAASI